MTNTLGTFSDPHQDGLFNFIRMHVELHDRGHASRPDWAHQSSFHLLLALGRRFSVAPRSHDLVGMPDGLCYSNSAGYATVHQADGVVYAEGFASFNVGGTDFPLPHAWVVRPDGTVLDPTWDDIPGRAYIGVPVADPSLWPVDGGGLFADFEKTLPLLRNGFPLNAIADIGQPLSDASAVLGSAHAAKAFSAGPPVGRASRRSQATGDARSQRRSQR